ncbi:MAG: diaminopimelate epimerase [Parachlamydiales bacterium]|nr:diaminopimelate epimerase [Parachlamydiales bacterium]
MKDGYFLAEGCQNTFLIYDAATRRTLDPAFLKWVHSYLIKEKRDDAMILVDGQADGDTFSARMVVLGVDAELGEFCGNGSRACAAYLFSHYPQYINFNLISNRGVHRLLRHSDGTYSTFLPRVNFEINRKFIAKPEMFDKNGRFYSFEFKGKHLFYADAIEPHLIVQEKLSDDELEELGKAVNQLKDLFPLGINVNSCRVINDHAIRVRTFERGVQRLTQACGTGSCCSSAWFLKDEDGRVQVTTLGGQLEIALGPDGLELRGPATIESFHPFDESNPL